MGFEIETGRVAAQPPAAGWPERVEQINAALEGYSAGAEGCPPRLQAAMHYALLGPGKRLRPLLTLFASEACGGQQDAAMPAACAVEMVHAYSLAHDDLPAMDDDELRRGRPTCHVQFGEEMAILAGDALLARAFEIMSSELQPASVAQWCCHELAVAAGRCNLVGGQVDDLDAETADRSLDRLMAIHQRKTGAMFLAPLRIGAMVATGAKPIEQVDRYGASLGLAFQIVDDLLDSEGSLATVGKKTGKDHPRGKLTFPGLLGVEESRRRAALLVQQACDAAESWGDPQGNLVALAQFVLTRNC